MAVYKDVNDRMFGGMYNLTPFERWCMHQYCHLMWFVSGALIRLEFMPGMKYISKKANMHWFVVSVRSGALKVNCDDKAKEAKFS